jgi:hypothetical protein
MADWEMIHDAAHKGRRAQNVRIQIYEFLILYFLFISIFFNPRFIDSADGDHADKAGLLYICVTETNKMADVSNFS